MKNFLYFLFGFVIVFSFGLCSAENYPGSCTKLFYAYPTSWSTSTVNTYAYTAPVFNFVTGTATSTPYAKGAGYQYGGINYILSYYDKDSSPIHWKVKYSGNGNTYLADWSNFATDYPQAINLPMANMTLNYFQTNYPSCDMNCPDSDSDGLCDVCDEDPNDSTVGDTEYLKGKYITKDGVEVATVISFSQTNSTYDMTTILPEYNYPEKFPGLNYVLGMPSYIDEKTFFESGGYILYLAKPVPLLKHKCNPVSSLDKCSTAVCSFDKLSIEKPINDSIIENGVNELATTEQKAEDAGLMDLDKTCDQLRSKCASSCGGSTNIKSFACSENKHMVCECLSDGKWELAEDWEELGQTITVNETTVNNNYGDGTSSEGGGNTTSVNGSDDGSLTGSYGYVEGNINYDTLGSHFSQFNSRFPFSLRSTLSSIYSDFKGTGVAPVYTYSVYGKNVTIDLAAWNDIAKMIRSFFALGITLSTIVLLIYLYVGIDLRGK